jgi:hypothetical protein
MMSEQMLLLIRRLLIRRLLISRLIHTPWLCSSRPFQLEIWEKFIESTIGYLIATV